MAALTFLFNKRGVGGGERMDIVLGIMAFIAVMVIGWFLIDSLMNYDYEKVKIDMKLRDFISTTIPLTFFVLVMVALSIYCFLNI